MSLRTKNNVSTGYFSCSGVNQCLETYLRCFVRACPKKWIQWLALAEFWYNVSFHSTLGTSPFHVLYGHEPRHWGVTATDNCSVPDLQSWLTERNQMTVLLRQHLNRAQQRMKAQADKNRTERSFEVGDMVFLKLQPYIQSSIAPRANHKLLFKYYGPYPVLAKVGTRAYRLELPSESSVHPVFHVSQLRQFVRPSVQALCVEDALWEDVEDLRACFPGALAWGQAIFQRQGTISDPFPAAEDGVAEGASATASVPKPRGKRMKFANTKYPADRWTS